MSAAAGGLDRVVPVTADTWDDLAALFGPSGAYSGCWCVWWRVTSKEFDAASNDQRRERLRDLVTADRQPGLLGYRDGEPVGWVSVGPRPEFGRALRSPLFAPARTHDVDRGEPDDTSVWSVVCFYVPRPHRGTGLMTDLLQGAVAHARERGASAVEGYAVDKEDARPADLFPGVRSIYEAAGFEAIARPSPTRVIMRRGL